MSQQTFVMGFTNKEGGVEAYHKYKKEVTDHGGTILNDFGHVIRAFTAIIPSALVDEIRSGNLAEKGISDFRADPTIITPATGSGGQARRR